MEPVHWNEGALRHYKERLPVPEGRRVARVIAEHRTEYDLFDQVQLLGVVRGSFHLNDRFPKVGDWVTYEPAEEGKAVIDEVLPRFTEIARKASGEDTIQVIAANVDLMLAVQGLDHDFNPRRLERYLILAKQSGCTPAVILTKSDLRKDVASAIAAVREIDEDVTVITVSVPRNEGVEEVRALLQPGMTAVMVGSSGAGKSTLLNALLREERMRTQEVRADDSRGRHTTTHRELFPLPNGSMIIDTPGMRELGLLPTRDTSRDEVYAAIVELINECRFADCDHDRSAGCRIKEAIESGEITEGSFQGYLKVLREEEFAEAKRSELLEINRLRETKAVNKTHKKIQQMKYGSQDQEAS